MSRNRVIVALVLVAAVVAAIAWSRREQPISVALTGVERGMVTATVSNTRAGTVDACKRAQMAPILGGQIAALPVREGDRVEAGAILLELWNADIRAEVLLAQQQQVAEKARADEACAVAQVAQREAVRMKRLDEQSLVSDEQLDLAQSDAKAKEAGCRAARSMVDVAAATVAVVEATRERSVLRAPFRGTVAEINGEVGEVVTPSPVGIATPPAVDLIDTSCIFVTAPIDEVDAPQVRPGMRARITLDAFSEQSFPATVRRVAPYVQALEKQARTVDIEAEFDAPNDRLLPGYSADVEVILDEHPNTLRVLTQAILPDSTVLVLGDDSLLESRQIRTGLSNWQFTEVLSGLDENQQIVLSIEREGVVAGAFAVAE